MLIGSGLSGSARPTLHNLKRFYLRSSVDNISFAIFAAFALFAAKSIFFNASAMNYHRFIQKQASI